MRRHDFGTNDICKHCGIPAASTGASGSECSRSDAATQAFDAIASACGCAEWEYPGQVVRDVQAVVRQRDDLLRGCTVTLPQGLPPTTVDGVAAALVAASDGRLADCGNGTVRLADDNEAVRLTVEGVLHDVHLHDLHERRQRMRQALGDVLADRYRADVGREVLKRIDAKPLDVDALRHVCRNNIGGDCAHDLVDVLDEAFRLQAAAVLEIERERVRRLCGSDVLTLLCDYRAVVRQRDDLQRRLGRAVDLLHEHGPSGTHCVDGEPCEVCDALDDGRPVPTRARSAVAVRDAGNATLRVRRNGAA
jgi:hypothetical protein